MRAVSLDHLVGARKQCRRHIQAKRLRGLEIDRQLVFGRRLHGEVGGLLAFEDAIDVAGRALIAAPDWRRPSPDCRSGAARRRPRLCEGHS